MVLDLTRHIVVAFTDDDEDDYLIYSEAIKALSGNIQLVYFTSCNALIEYLQQHTPDLVFLDINLGGMSSVDCIKHIRSLLNGAKVPIVIQSTAASEQVIKECIDHGANHYLVKPRNYALLEQEVRKVFAKEW